MNIKLTTALFVFILLFCNGVFANNSLLKVKFKPANPVMHLSKPTKVGNVTVYDHSEFSIKLINRHFYPIHIKSVHFTSNGNYQKSGLGDIANYWPWKGGQTLNSGKSISFNKVWGFTVDTPNTEMTYQFKFVYSIGDNSKEHVVIKDLVLRPKD